MFNLKILKKLLSVYFVFFLIILAGIFSFITGEHNGPEYTNNILPTEAFMFAGGDGSAGNPYQISNVTELQWMGDTSNLGLNFTLIKDIDAFTTRIWNSGFGFDPIGNFSNKFTGFLDGQGFKINGLFINRSSTDNVGLFGYISFGGLVNNVSLLNNNITGDYDVGGLIGWNYGTVNNSYTTGSVWGDSNVGGLVGRNHGIVNNSHAIGNVSGFEDSVGGLVGTNVQGTVNNSYAIGNVSGTGTLSSISIGGLVGHNTGTVSNSFATGAVSGYKFIGGLVGSNDGTVSNSYAKGKVNGGHFEIGGLIGWNYQGTVTNSYATGNVTGNSTFCNSLGGLVGDNLYGKIKNSYATGNVSGSNRIGGLLGKNGGTVTYSYASGNIIASDEYIGGLIGWNDEGIVTYSYATGAVTGFTNWCEYIGGLVGMNDQGTVNFCYATGNVSGTYCQVGGLIGHNNLGTVENCYATSNVSAIGSAGGLVGYTYFGTVTNSYASGLVNGTTQGAGGFIGANDQGTVTNSYATGVVIGYRYVGGFIGANDRGTVENCYSAGMVTGTIFVGGFCGNNSGTISKCFFDNKTSGMTTSDGGTSKNTSKMKKKSTFTGVGWNFIKIWSIIDIYSYPFLQNFNYSISFGDLVGLNKEDAYEDVPYMTDYDIRIIETNLPGVMNLSGALGLDTNASFLSINNTGGLIGIPRNDDVGIYFVNISIEILDFDLLKYTDFMLTVHNTNDVPHITSLPLLKATEDSPYNYLVIANDDDLNISVGENLTYSFDFAPGGMNINSFTGLIQWVPTNTQTHQNYTVIINVTDLAGTFDTQEFIINVTNSNDVPMITSTAVTTAIEDQMYEYQLTATDDDFQNPSKEKLTFSLDTALEEMTIDSESGLIQWLPTNDDVGAHWVNVTVSDIALGSNSQNFTLTVINVNDPPMITEIVDQTTPANKTINMGKISIGEYDNFTLEAIDIDGDVLDCESNNNVASIIKIGLNLWNISFYPASEGIVIISFTVSDKTESDHINLTWAVLSLPPSSKISPSITINSENNKKTKIGEKIIIEGTWYDPDSEIIDEIWIKQQFPDKTKTDFYKPGYSESDYNELSEEHRTGQLLTGVYVWEYLSINTDGTWKYMFDTKTYNSAYEWYMKNQPGMMEKFGLVAKLTKGDMIFFFKAIDDSDLESNEQSIKVLLESDDVEVIDKDNDGLPDDWEILYFNDISNCSPNEDPDKDGKTNLEEYQDGTNPNELIDEPPSKKPKEKPDKKETEWPGAIIAGIVLLTIIIVVIVVIFFFMKKKKPVEKPELDSVETTAPLTPSPTTPPQPPEQQPKPLPETSQQIQAEQPQIQPSPQEIPEEIPQEQAQEALPETEQTQEPPTLQQPAELTSEENIQPDRSQPQPEVTEQQVQQESILEEPQPTVAITQPTLAPQQPPQQTTTQPLTTLCPLCQQEIQEYTNPCPHCGGELQWG